ncbi:unnamed protein product [Amoebophrya sp. A120]|nr:unnamed protein product [Amoebophrya sp. A120]|eukprot:GSA120T00014145001.1
MFVWVSRTMENLNFEKERAAAGVENRKEIPFPQDEHHHALRFDPLHPATKCNCNGVFGGAYNYLVSTAFLVPACWNKSVSSFKFLRRVSDHFPPSHHLGYELPEMVKKTSSN